MRRVARSSKASKELARPLLTADLDFTLRFVERVAPPFCRKRSGCARLRSRSKQQQEKPGDSP
jgi:hypothetical protein